MYGTLFRHALFPFYETVLRGRPTLRHLALLERHQWLGRAEIERLGWEKLGRLLHHTYEQVPYYRQQWDALGLRPQTIHTPQDFAALPVLTKADIRAHADALEARDYVGRNTIASRSSGSTGEPISFRYAHDSEHWRVASTARSDRWAGWDWGRKEAYVWGVPLVAGSRLQRGKKSLHHALLRRRSFNSFELSEASLPRVTEHLRRFGPEVIIGYTNALYVLARYFLDHGLSLQTPPRGVIASAEMLYDFQRTAIEQAFGCPVFNRYGCREMRLIAAECDRHDGLHINAENVYVEILRGDGSICEPDEVGHVVLTDLNNLGMPFIRYRVGDLGALRERPCSCGRGLPLVEAITGRELDVIHLPDGRHLDGHFFTHLLLMREIPGLESYQFAQTAPDRVIARIVRSPAWTDDAMGTLRAAVERHLGDAVKLDFEFVETIPLTRSGKWRVVVGLSPDSLGTTPHEELSEAGSPVQR